MVHQSKVLPARGADGYPLSPLQQGMLYHKLDGSSGGVDLEQVVCELHEPVDPDRFRQAWEQVTARHEILRTGFHLENGAQPRQVAIPAAEAPLTFRYDEFAGEAEARRALQAFLRADRRRGFPELHRPLFRVALLRGGPGHFWFVTTFDHLLLDGRALVVMFKEALDRHDALIAGRTLELPSPTPYRRYIEWLESVDWTRAGEFWREYLQGLTGPTVLPVPRPAGTGMDDVDARGELAFRLSAVATGQLRAAAARHKVTLNTMMQAAWAVVLSRYTGEDDVVFGAVRACRHIPVPGAESIVGLFINTVPVRVRTRSDAPVGPWLQGLREQWVAFRDYEHTPLIKAQSWSGIAPGRALFETLFNYQEPSWDAALRRLGGRWERRHFDIVSQPNYPLAVDAYGGAVITVKMFYDRRRFADETVNRLMGHYRVVVEALAAGRPATVGGIPLLSTTEQRQLLVRWNRTASEYPDDRCVHTCVEAQAAAAPARLAVDDGTTTLTYGALDTRAGRLAARLRAHGVGPDRVVAVCLERSAEMLVAWLAVLKAGGAFCPLDPNYPPERLAFMLRDSGAPVVLTQLSMMRRLPPHSAAVVCLDEPGSAGVSPASEEDGRPEARAPGSDNLAYVIYTSGSTGQPKGVMIEHRALVNLVTWHQRTFGVTSADRAPQLASPAFDASVWEVWPYLATGASVHIPPEEVRVSAAQLWRWLAEKQITIGFVPTPLLEAAMDEPWPEGLALRLLLTGGDKLKRGGPEDFPCPLVNNYGPTENTVVATSGVVPPASTRGTTPTIGRPIANTRVYVLDREFRPVPVGVPGELFIAGGSLARGYLRRPGLTGEKFPTLPVPGGILDPVCHPMDDTGAGRSGERVCHLMDDEAAGVRGESVCHSMGDGGAGVRMYRTGDRVRWTEEGELEFLGRLDGQVKIRGCRLELGEIEAVLQQHAFVRECLAVIRPDDRGEPQLVAYVVPAATPAEGEAGPDHRIREMDLVSRLRQKLPAYMMPSGLVLLDRWPLTPNGKIDRDALPAPAARTGDGRDGFAAPANETEQTVARVWAEILGRGPIGRHDNFFDLGGHSLLAAQVVSRLNHALQTALSVRTVFDQPTVAGFARELESRRQAATGPRIRMERPRRRRASPEILQPN